MPVDKHKNDAGLIKMTGIGADIIWDRLEKLTDKMADQSTGTTQVLASLHNTVHNISADIEVLKNQQTACMTMHNDKKAMCVLADPNDTVTKAINKMTSQMDFHGTRVDYSKWLLILIAFLIAALVALVGIKLAIPTF